MSKRKGYDLQSETKKGEGAEGILLEPLDGKGKKIDEDVDNNLVEIRSSEKVELKRTVTLINGIAIIVGSIIGSGIFLTPTDVYYFAQNSYVAIGVWVVSGLFSLVGALCFAELGTCITRSGGDYAYILEAFGKLPAFICLWVTIIVIRPTTVAVIAVTFATYAIKPFYGDCVPHDLLVPCLATLCILILTAVNCISVKLTMKIQDLFTAAKLIALVAIILCGFFFLAVGLMYPNEEKGRVISENVFTQKFPFEDGKGFDPILLSLSVYQGLFAYAGWNYLNFVTAELIDPYKNLPRCIWIGLPLVTLIYVLTNCAYFIVLSPSQILKSSAVAVSFGELTFGRIQFLIPIAVALSTFGGVNGTLFTSARLFFVGAEQKQLPQILGCIHLKKCTPVPALVLQALISILVLTTGSIRQLISYVSFVLWVSTGVAVGALLYLRKIKPDIERPIRIPLFFPILYICATFFLVACSIYADPYSTGMGTLITFTGFPVYFFFIYYRSKKCQWSDKWIDSCTIFFQKVLNVMPQENSDSI